jgi:hypothetical protein
MKKRTCAVACLLHVSRQWAWVSFIPLLAGACKPRPLVCDAVGFFQVLQPQEGAGVAPFSIERLGPEVKRLSVAKVPDILSLRSNNRVNVSWGPGDFVETSDLIFSPSEGLARDVQNPENVYPMRRFSDGTSERVRFGFRAPPCRPRRAFAECTPVGDPLYLAAEMTCQPERESRFSR